MDKALVCLTGPETADNSFEAAPQMANLAEMRDAMDALDWGGDPRPLNLPAPPAGHIVYFVGAEDGPVKIGFTQQPIKERLKCIQNGSPTKLRVLAALPAFRQKERLYHKLFAPIRLHGEWFQRHPLLLREIDWINGVPGVNPVTRFDANA